MKPPHLSASSLKSFEECPAKFKAEYIDKARDASSGAADLGTTCHKVLELWVKDGYYKTEGLEKMLALYADVYNATFTDLSKFKDGRDMLERWYNRTDLTGRSIISTEKFENFFIAPTLAGRAKFVYVLDRLDINRDDEPEVTDYKTVSQPMQPSDIENGIQGRLYALATQLRFPKAERIWVTMDLLRFDTVSVAFTKEQNRATYKYLARAVDRVYAATGNEEKLNSGCRWCVRRHACRTLQKHLSVGGPLSITDVSEAADKLKELTFSMGAAKAMMDDLSTVILDHCEKEDLLDFETDTTKVKITARKTREIDSREVAAIVGDELTAKYGKFTISVIDLLLKSTEISDEQKSQLKQIIGVHFGNPSVKVEELAPGSV